MTFESRAGEIGRQPIWMVELELDRCANTYGQAPCTASNVNRCFNTFRTCQDTPNYDRTGPTWTYRFIPMGMHVDLTVPELAGAIPSLTGPPRFASAEAEPGSIGRRGSVTVELFDMVAGDNIDTDPYQDTRVIAAEGTWWSRLVSRHRYFYDRPLRVYEGYADEPLAEWRVRNYFIESVAGPTRGGRVSVRAKDPLKALSSDRSLFPRQTETTLDGNHNPNVTTIDLISVPPGFVTGAVILIGDEKILLGTQAGNSFTGCTRGYEGTSNTNHSDGAQVLLVVEWTNKPIEEAVQDVILTAGLPASMIPYAEWQAEIATFLPGRTINGEMWQARSAEKMLNEELLPENNLSLFWDEIDQLIRLRVGSAFQNVAVTFNQEDHVINGDVVITDQPRRQVTACTMFYGPTLENYGRNPDKDDMQFVDAYLDAGAESAEQYGRRQLREYASRWFHDGDTADVALTVRQWVERFGEMPSLMAFQIDAKDIQSVRLGDVIDVFCDQYVDFQGRRTAYRGQILKERAVIPGHSYELTLLKYFPPETTVVPAELVISANVSNYNVYNELGGPPEPITVIVRIQTGVIVSSLSAANPAFTTGSLHPDSEVTIIREIDAIVTGAGGDGGDGALAGRAGERGGNAIEFLCDGIIQHDNGGADTGYIAAGGGGGGAGGDDLAGVGNVSGGGGGAGTSPGSGGTGNNTGVDGSDGTATTGGAGGVTPGGIGSTGRGGDLGRPGGGGAIRFDTDPGLGDIFTSPPGGSSGSSIVTNGNAVSLDATANVIGPIDGEFGANIRVFPLSLLHSQPVSDAPFSYAGQVGAGPIDQGQTLTVATATRGARVNITDHSVTHSGFVGLAGIRLGVNGILDERQLSSYSPDADEWIEPADRTATVGQNFEVRFTETSSIPGTVNGGDTLGVWHSLASSREVWSSNPNPGLLIGRCLVEIRPAGGGAVIDSANMQFNVTGS